MTHEEILSMLGDYVDYLIANSSAEAPMWNIEKVRSGKPNKWNYIDWRPFASVKVTRAVFGWAPSMSPVEIWTLSPAAFASSGA